MPKRAAPTIHQQRSTNININPIHLPPPPQPPILINNNDNDECRINNNKETK
jgi:hypothetical protein